MKIDERHSAEPVQLDGGGLWLRLRDVGGAMAVCTFEGRLLDATPAGRSLLQRLGVGGGWPAQLSEELWAELAAAPPGAPAQWRRVDPPLLVGCTRYPLGRRELLLVMKEISDRARAEALRLHEQRLEAAGRLVAFVAHDLRAPLSCIVFNTGVLCDKLDQLPREIVQRSLEEIRHAAARLRGTVDGLLDFVRLGPPVVLVVSLEEALQRVAGLLRPLLRERGGQLSWQVTSGAERVRGNPLVIEQILVNLVMNAVEASPRPVQVQVCCAPGGGPAGDQVQLLVSDDGPGIPAELRAHVFEPFFTTKHDGTGLGLTTAREAANGLGGSLQLESQPPSGACFTLCLPRAEPAAEADA